MKVLRILNIRAKTKAPCKGKSVLIKCFYPCRAPYILYNVYTRYAAYSYIHSALLTALAPLAAGACAGDAARQ